MSNNESKHTPYEKRTIDNTEICKCGNVFVEDDDYDTLGAEGPVCCPDCGNEKFISLVTLVEQRDALLGACKAVKQCLDIMDNGDDIITKGCVYHDLEAAIAKVEDKP